LGGGRRYARRAGVDAAPGYRNGAGKPRRLSLSFGTITVRRPRVELPQEALLGWSTQAEPS
jgi:putative transposase